MKLRVQILSVFLCLFVLASVLPAGNVFVLSDGATSHHVQVFSGDPLAAVVGAYDSGPGPVTSIFPGASGAYFYTVAASATDALVAVDQSFFSVFRSGDWNAVARTGVLTPDGKLILVLANSLHIIDAATNTDLAQVITGPDPHDVAASINSRYAFVLSPNSRLLYQVDLTTYAITKTLQIPGQSTAVAVGPDANVYVSGTNRIYVIDPVTLTKTTEIPLNGLPNKVYFTPDGRYAVATNQTPITGASGWIFDLSTNSIVSTVPKILTPSGIITMTPRVWVPDNGRAFFTSADSQIIYTTQIPAGGINVLNVVGIPGSPTEVTGIAISNEMPVARYLYYTQGLSLTRVDLGSNQRSGTPAGLSAQSFGLRFAAPPSTGVPVATILYNNNQNIAAGGEFHPIVVRALDANGRPVFNAPVFFNAVDGVTIENAMATTNRDGLALAWVNPGDVTGPIPVNVTIGSGLTAVFDLTVGGGGAGGGAGISIVSGNGQLIADQYFSYADPLVVMVRDAAGKPKAGATVSWVVTNGDGIVNPVTSVTDADGKASTMFTGSQMAPGFSWSQSTITATGEGSSVDFYYTSYPTSLPGGGLAPPPEVIIEKPPLTERNFTGQSGQTLQDAIEVGVFASTGIYTGRPIPNVAVAASTGLNPDVGPTVSCGGSYVLTGAEGRAQCDLLLGGLGTAPFTVSVGVGYRFWNMGVTVTPGVPAVVVVVQGDGQTGNQGATLPVDLVAKIQDAFGNKLPGSVAQWEVVKPGSVTLSNVVDVADANGLVRARATLGALPGTATVRVRSGTGIATFRLTVLVNITQLQKVSGDGQEALTNVQFASPLVVELRDDQNEPVANQQVSFLVGSGSATVASPTATTDSQGRAMMNVAAGAQPGDITIVASFPGVDPVSFHLTSRLPGPAITPASFFNGASGEPGVVPGSVVKIVAPGLAAGIQNCVMPGAQVGALPRELAGVTVQFGPDSSPQWAPIYYVCNVNGEESVAVQAPFELTPGNTPVTIRVHSGATTIENVPVLAAQPGIFQVVGSDGLPYGVVVRADGSFASPENPVARDEIAGLFATGLGPLTPPAGTNQAGFPGQAVSADIVVGINHQGVRVVGGEYAVNMIGVYVVYFEVPADATPGPDRPLQLAIRAADGSLILGPGTTIAIK